MSKQQKEKGVARVKSSFEHEDHTEQSQEIVETLCSAECRREKEDKAVACLCFMVTADGRIRSRAVNVEPEHVLPFLVEQRKMTSKLEDFLASIEASKAQVIEIKRR